MEKTFKGSVCLVAVAVLSILALSAAVPAGQGSFREEFTRNYKENRFKAQELLVKASGEIMAEEIRLLTADALGEDKGHDERMYILDIASAMASMYSYWHGDRGPLKEVRAAIAKELQKEKKRTAELTRWDSDEGFLGNFVMRRRAEEMEAAAVAPVVYPHWIHRIWFQCKVCHDGIFAARRTGNDINQDDILAGRQCGVCHNNDLAFGADKDCERCHNAGRPEAEHLQDLTKIDNERIKQVASRIGAKWRPENLPDGRLPVDRFKFIDWLELERLKAFRPVNRLDHDEDPRVRDNTIFFKSASDFVKDVLFDHRVHSFWVNCSTCHTGVFAEELGASEIVMAEMSAGATCGLCHGRVSFTFADCLRCHSRAKGVVPEGALVRESRPKSEK